MAGWLALPLDRLRDVITGAYPTTPVPGRSIAAGTFKETKLHGDLESEDFAAVHFHRGFALVVERSGQVATDAPNVHGGSMRRRAVVLLKIGYLYGRDAPLTGAGSGGALWQASIDGHEDHEQIEQAARYPAHWGGLTPTLVSMLPIDDATLRVIAPQRRALVERRWELVVSYAPGSTWA